MSEDLLPANATAFERGVTLAMTDVLPVPIRELLDPAQTLIPFIPFLAEHESVDLWFDDWTVARKRTMIEDALRLAGLKGTRLGLRSFLTYVDALLISTVAHPRRFVLGRSALGVQPLKFPAYTALYLIKVGLKRHRRGLVLGRGALGRHALVRVDREPIRRANIAATVSKAPGTQYTATFAHRRRPFFDEMAFGMGFDEFIDRKSL
ncbi:phage tail protein I [Afipia carboxidovorans OM5]|uniref:Putative phage tail protein I n=1 Tax=Afipia carboxidovorans (strain ATCC 49405 / DSM 1227 / KCTC 32145 / OM5) TaxID=504832 RepID=B6JEF3_AFIC5|nr:phage tail protein I [Afipia carboxidovorans]ACI92718.1 phage tail protein I [Afipia carboxidovorans OM5]AEI03530.1 putative phage tail protein I [Afipia carboxidovorans OM4]AEI07107.1 putative phage tail protein I [Afipia carboxidovorans OM5]BEV44683.1 phage tail protein I [Afipia carboxidovorans]